MELIPAHTFVPRSKTHFGRPVLLVLVTLLAYAPALRGHFLWDDLAHVPPRPTLYTLSGLRQIWTVPGYVQQYYPLTFTTIWVAHHLWGIRPVGYHALTLTFHIFNAFLIVWLLLKLECPGPWLAGFLFALHPVQVESVAWISEVKNTQSTFFALLALGLYWRWAARSSRRDTARYAMAFLCYLAALFSKTVTCTLPVILGILILWKNGRLTRKDLGALSPLLAVGVFLGLKTASWERGLIGATGPDWNFSWLQRFAIAARAFWFYIGKLLWPHPLMFIYPRWDVSTLLPLGAGLVLAAVILFAALAFVEAPWSRAALVALSIFGITLAPALGFVNVFPMKYSFVADHFQYAACISLLALTAAGLNRLPKSISAAICLLFGILTWTRAQAFTNEEKLWRIELARYPTCAMAHLNLRRTLIDRGDVVGARQEALVAVRLAPQDVHTELAAGDQWLHLEHQPARAVPYLTAAYDAASKLPLQHATEGLMAYIHLVLGEALMGAGRHAEAQAHYEQVLRYIPSLTAQTFYDTTPEVMAAVEADCRDHLALLLEEKGDLAGAIAQWEAALRVAPSPASLEQHLGDALQKNHQSKLAVGAYRRSLAASPGASDVHRSLATLLDRQGQWDEAITEYRQATELNPDLTNERYRLAALLLKENRKAEAVAEYQAALQSSHGTTAHR